MEYAIVRLSGKQYKVKKGDIVEVNRLRNQTDKELSFDDVLLWVSDGKIKIGKPKVLDVKVRAKILDNIKGKKIIVGKFKSKVRYRRKLGFRPVFTKLQIEEIEIEKEENRALKKASSKKAD